MATEIERGGMDVGGPHEPSYYEIALTNRQVVVAFVVLLICLVAAFFSGVWMGRESSLRTQQQLARAAAAAAPGADRQDAQGQPLREFKFFNETAKKPGRAGRHRPEQAASQESTAAPAGSAASAGSERADRSSAPSTEPVSRPSRAAGAGADQASGQKAGRRLGERAAAPPVRAAAPPEPAGEGEPLPAPADRAAGAGGASRRAASIATDPAAPADSGAPNALPSSGAAPASGRSAAAAGATDGAGPLVIQVFSSSDKSQAEKVRDRLLKTGQTAFLSPIDKLGRTMYRVRIGPFASREKAEKVAEQVRKQQHLDTWITPR